MRRWAVALIVVGLALGGLRLALPAAVEAVPGRYLVRLQQHPVTARVLNWIRPIPTTLPFSLTPLAPRPPQTLWLTPEPPTPTPIPTATRRVAAAESPAPSPTPTPLPTPMPAAVTLPAVPVVWQDFSNCGPANLSIALNYFGQTVSQQTIAERVRPNEEDRNVTPWELSAYVNAFTPLQARAFSGGDLALLRQLVAAGAPVTIQRGYTVAEQGWFGHYLTIYGYDSEQGVFYSRDTSGGPFDGSARVDDFGRIQAMWQQFNYNFYVVFSAELAPSITAILGADRLDARQMWQRSAAQAEADLTTDPANAFAWFNLGINLTHLGDLTAAPDYYANAAAAFDQARQIGIPPRLPFYQHEIFRAYQMSGRQRDLLWLTTTLTSSVAGARFVEEIDWYHALALLADGDRAGAREFLERALRVNPRFTPAQTGLDALGP